MRTAEESTAPKNRRRKIQAVLAGGAVLGIGAAVTLANWTDQNWAEGLFGGGHYAVESSETGEEGSFSTHQSVTDADELVFEFSENTDNAAPGEEFTATWYVRVNAETSYDGVITALETYEGNDGGEAFSWEATTDGAAVVEALLPQGADGDPGETVEIDFLVTAAEDPDVLRGADETITWQLATESVVEGDDD